MKKILYQKMQCSLSPGIFIMFKKLRSVAFILILSLSFIQAAQAVNFVQITVDEMGTPFFLDDEGHVWGYKFLDLIKLPNLEHIKQIAPYIAVDDEGHVFTWAINDKEAKWLDEETLVFGYTPPKRVGELKGVTIVAHSWNHYFAVIDNQEIVRWSIVHKKRGIGVENYGPIKKVISHPGIKAIAAAPGTTKRIVSEPAPFGLVALFDDGTVMGWGISATGQVVKEANTPSVLLTKSPGATGIAMNTFHTVVLTAQGVPLFWGSCDLEGRGIGINQTLGQQNWTWGSVRAVAGYVNDVKVMALAQDFNEWGIGGWGDDNHNYDVFIKRDGTVWLAYAPVPESAQDYQCGQDRSQNDYRKAVQVPAGKAAAIQVAKGKGSIYMLDEEHKLWETDSNNVAGQFKMIEIK